MDLANHPCFNAEVRHTTGRIHLPVAAKCNIQCNFCNRKYDCVNESRPGVTSVILSPAQALTYLDAVLAEVDNIAVVGIAGPGDPFANPGETIRTLELVHEKYPDKLLCLASNGLGLPEHIEKIAALNISHVTITVNAIDPEIGARIYPWVRLGPKTYRGVDGARVLLQRQTESIKLLKANGITVKINTVIIPGINDLHAPDVAAYTAHLGADVQNCMPMVHVDGTVFENIPSASVESIKAIRSYAGRHISQMSHCSRCRADAAGIVGCQNSNVIDRLLAEAAAVKASAERPYVAVASMEGLFVNRHLGEAAGLRIYTMVNGKVTLKEQRPTPAPGSGDKRWEDLAEIISDCTALLVSHCGPNPKKILEEKGVRVITSEGFITETAGPILEGREIPKIFTAKPHKIGCDGTGSGCG